MIYLLLYTTKHADFVFTQQLCTAMYQLCIVQFRGGIPRKFYVNLSCHGSSHLNSRFCKRAFHRRFPPIAMFQLVSKDGYEKQQDLLIWCNLFQPHFRLTRLTSPSFVF